MYHRSGIMLGNFDRSVGGGGGGPANQQRLLELASLHLLGHVDHFIE